MIMAKSNISFLFEVKFMLQIERQGGNVSGVATIVYIVRLGYVGSQMKSALTILKRRVTPSFRDLILKVLKRNRT